METEIIREMIERDLAAKEAIKKSILWIKTRQIMGIVLSVLILIALLFNYFLLRKNIKDDATVIKMLVENLHEINQQ